MSRFSGTVTAGAPFPHVVQHVHFAVTLEAQPRRPQQLKSARLKCIAGGLTDFEAEGRRRAAGGSIASVRADAAGDQRRGHQGRTGVQRAVLRSSV